MQSANEINEIKDDREFKTRHPLQTSSDRFGCIDVTLLDGAYPEHRDVPRVHLRDADDFHFAEFDVMPSQHKRVEIVVGDHVISIAYTPPKLSPHAPPPPEPMRPARLTNGLR